jgi:hypothetical protein
MNSKLILIGLIISISLIPGVLASIVALPPCYIEGEIKEINWEMGYTEYNSTYGCDAFPCTPHDRNVPARYVVTVNITYAQESSDDYCVNTYRNKQIDFLAYETSLASNIMFKTGNIIQGNVTSFLEEDYFINGQYELTYSFCSLKEDCYPEDFVSAEMQEYLPGDVIVGFNDNVTEEEANLFFESYNLEWESHFPKMFSIWADYKPELKDMEGYNVRNNLSQEIVEKDKEDNRANYIVLWAEARGDRILIQFNTRATEETADELLSSFEGLETESPYYASKWGVAKVIEGDEQEWIDIFKNESIIRYAELNGINYATSEIKTDDETCKNLYWIDDTNKECNNRTYCGTYLYRGLQTFADENECRRKVATICPLNERMLPEECPFGEIVSGERDENGCYKPDICIKNNNTYNLSNGRVAEIKVMPETASALAVERLGELGFNITLKEVGGKAVYHIEAEKEAKIFGFIKSKAKIELYIDAESDGKIISINKPWWAFLASGI